MNPPSPPDEPSSPPSRKSFWSWLFTSPPIEPADERADRFFARLRSSNAGIATRAEGELRRIAFDWETYLYEADFVVLVLRRLQETGDINYLPYIERLALDRARSADQKKVREAAQACVAALQAASQQEETRHTLLRASETPPPDPAILLRPAEGASETTPEELLRASRRNPTP